jgi:DNA-directed RNA polymerase subunit RPC12/RpoP
MADFITLSCPSCGAKLEVTPDIDRFACAHCGQEHIVKRSGGIVSLSPVVDAIKRVQTGVDKTAAELGIVRLQKEIHELSTNKNIFIREHPQPHINPFAFFFLITGGILLFLSLPFFQLENGVFITLLIIGLVMIGLGPILIIPLKGKKETWERETGTMIDSMEAVIAAKQSELDSLRNIVKL